MDALRIREMVFGESGEPQDRLNVGEQEKVVGEVNDAFGNNAA
jgi:hypothetical protein